MRERGSAYTPRTRHLSENGRAKYTNRLFLESSPYLLQHAHNPVDWYPWGDEAFETAQKLQRPVFVSIGYSTCHWCHVMEEESFEDEGIAEYLNRHYVSIKVDREERPDVDSIYMSAVQALTGQGGWPLNVWLTPDRKPFYAGTYFPARDGDRGAATGFLTLLTKIKELYAARPEAIRQSSTELTAAIRKMLATAPGGDLPKADLLHKAIAHYKNRFDSKYGGIEGAPKFPSSLPIKLLLRYHRRTNDSVILDMAVMTLAKMARGGIYDHVGGGFHRYATDENWMVPHFEKMLYDNALLASTYLEGYQATGNSDFARMARDILHYIKRDMTSPEGAFYSATDADSPTPDGHMAEGAFFTWTPDEIDAALGRDRGNIIQTYYGVDRTAEFEGRYILNTPLSIADAAAVLKITPDELQHVIDESRPILYDARQLRPPPLRDEKLITSWNGLMISAFARSGLMLSEPSYIACAQRATAFILNHLHLGGRLYRTYKDKAARHNACLDDYAYFIGALLDLYEATHEPYWLEKAMELDATLSLFYEDRTNGGFFMTSSDHEALIAREKSGWEGALPSGNAVAALNLLRLGELTTDSEYDKRAEKLFASFSNLLSSSPSALSSMLLAADFHLDTPKEIVIVTPEKGSSTANPFLDEFRKQFLPNSTLTVVNHDRKTQKNLEDILPSVKDKSAVNGMTTAYLCEKGACGLPTTQPDEFARQITHVTAY